jgi:protein required for attachment to host cells
MTVYQQNLNLQKPSLRKYFVVANRVGARIFVKHGSNEPTLVKRLEHLKGRMHDREFGTDKPGRAFERWAGTSTRHSLSQEVPPHEQELQHFTSELAEQLQKDRLENIYDELILGAEPRFSGALFGRLDEATKDLVSKKVHKDLGNLDDLNVIHYLAQSLD